MKNKRLFCLILLVGVAVIVSYNSNNAKLVTKADAKSESKIQKKVNYKYFKDVKWIDRNGIYSLSIRPKKSLRWSFDDDDLKKSWKELKKKFSNDEKRPDKDKEEVFYDQYKCHFVKAKIKGEWNLEPSRESINWFCN